jgi:DNA polymerase-3 subunit delta
MAKGENPTSVCIGTVKHFRTLHTLASNPENMETSLSKIWPPVFGAKRTKLMSDSKRWGLKRIERSIQILLETDLRLRSPSLEPKNALIERALIRICMMAIT